MCVSVHARQRKSWFGSFCGDCFGGGRKGLDVEEGRRRRGGVEEASTRRCRKEKRGGDYGWRSAVEPASIQQRHLPNPLVMGA